MTGQTPRGGKLTLYRTADNAVRVEVLCKSETFWLEQRRMAELFGVDVRTVSYHLKDVYASVDLSAGPTLRRIRRVQRYENRKILVSAEVARRLAKEQYDKYRVRQYLDFECDFDAELNRIDSKRSLQRKEES